jgi:hypothetical protein
LCPTFSSLAVSLVTFAAVGVIVRDIFPVIAEMQGHIVRISLRIARLVACDAIQAMLFENDCIL